MKGGGREPHVLKTRYSELLPVSTPNLQAEGLTCLRRALYTAGDDVVQLQTELQVYDSAYPLEVLDNRNRPYTVAVYYRPRSLYYIDIPPADVAQYISGHLRRVMDMYFGYRSRSNCRMRLFDGTGPPVPSYDEDATSAY